METRRISGYHTFPILVSLQFLIVLLAIISILFGLLSANLFFDDINVISIGSLFFFIALCLVTCLSTKFYFTILVFQIIAFPSVVDNFIPGVYFGDSKELGSSIFPILTHIDFYLLLGIILQLIKKRKVHTVSSRVLTITVIILLLSSLVNLFYSKDTQDFILIVAGFFHLRYLIWFFLLLSVSAELPSQKSIIDGLILSVLFLVIEAISFSVVNNDTRLTSGTLGNNSFANVIACITVYFIFIYRARLYNPRILLLFTIGIGLLAIVLTATRMAILGGLLLFFTGVYFVNRNSFVRMFYALSITVVVTSALLFTDLYDRVPERFDVKKLVSKVHLNFLSENQPFIEIEPHPETLSLITRLKLYETSVNMITENWWFGIGSMRWDYHKNKYGFEENILVDSHNGYLAILSQFGLFSIFFIYFIYFWAIRLLKENLKLGNKFNAYLALIPFGMAICDFSNAGIYKHQIYGLMCLIVMILLFHKQNGTKT